MLRSNLFILILISTFSIYAQNNGAAGKQIHIANTYTEFGEPIGPANFNFVEPGKTFSIILSNGGKEFGEHLVFLFIEKQGEPKKDNQFSKLIRTEKGKYFVAFNYTFESEGKYDIYFTDFARHKIASVTITVKTIPPKLPEKAAIGESLPSLNIIFCKRVIGEVPVNHVKSVSLTNDGGEVYIYIVDENPLRTNKISISVWKKKNKAGFDQLTDTKKFEVSPAWRNTYFKFKFESEGEYKINVSGENEILFKSAYITVEK